MLKLKAIISRTEDGRKEKRTNHEVWFSDHTGPLSHLITFFPQLQGPPSSADADHLRKLDPLLGVYPEGGIPFRDC